jgi:hypothetical protein
VSGARRFKRGKIQNEKIQKKLERRIDVMSGKHFLSSRLKVLLFIGRNPYDCPLHLFWATTMKSKGWLKAPSHRNRGDFRAFR